MTFIDSNRRSIELLCDTPGTTIDRKVLLYFEVNALDKRIIAKFINPKKKINVEGKSINIIITIEDLNFNIKDIIPLRSTCVFPFFFPFQS